MHRLSIIIPVLNEKQNIRECLLGLQQYRQQGHEVIVVDGGSTDSTRDIASHLCDLLLDSEPGRARQMNTGATAARGEVLLFLHADTVLPDNACNNILNLFRKSSHVWGRFDVRLSGKNLILRLIARLMNVRSRMTGIATGDQAIFVRQDTFRKLKGYPEVELMEDIRFSKALLSHSKPLCISNRAITSSRRWEEKGIIKTILLMWYLRLAHFFGKSPNELAKLYSR